MISTKWPGLLVKGDPISPDLALEINLRTFGWGSNELPYLNAIAAYILGEDPPSSKWDLATYSFHECARGALGALDLEYLRNDWILSDWVGGPKGWCRPDGRIWTNNYNIGKWPEDEDVKRDLKAIAAAWPTLSMTVQCLDTEIGEDSDPMVVSEWRVKSGKVRARAPGALVLSPASHSPFCLNECGIEPSRVFDAIDRLFGRASGPRPPFALRGR